MTLTGKITESFRHHAGQLGRSLRQGVDDLFPRPWLEQWREAQADGWKADEPGDYCPRCGCTLHATAITSRGCAFCFRQTLPWTTLTRLSEYQEPMASWIRDFKFHRQHAWGKLLGNALAQKLAPPVDPDHTLICPVPLHPWRRIRRGYNQSLLVAKAIGKTHHLPVVKLLKRTRLRPSQSTLPVSARKANVRHVFAIAPVDLAGHHIWLVDDVKTTGATLRMCARLLKQAGAERVDLAVLAAADPKGKNFKQL